MVARKSRAAIDQSHDPIVLEWLVALEGELRCDRCGVSVRIEKVGQYSDGIPEIQLPHDWFAVHGDPNHSASTAPAPTPEPAPAPPELELEKTVEPISQEDAKKLTGADAYRILCGAPRQEVLRHRQAVLAGLEDEVDPLWKRGG